MNLSREIKGKEVLKYVIKDVIKNKNRIIKYISYNF